MNYYIYTLTNPNNNEVFYVGVTKNLRSRWCHHDIYPKLAKYGDIQLQTPKNNYILKNRISPIIEELEVLESLDEARRIEQYWIWQFKSWGFDIKNGIRYQSHEQNHKKTEVNLKNTLSRKSYII